MHHFWLIPILPLAGFAVNGLFGRRLPKSVINAVAIGSVLLSFLWVLKTLSALMPLESPRVEHYFTWIASGDFQAGIDFAIDRLSAVMLLVVTGVGLLIHIYAAGYMAHEGGYYRFFAYLNLFMFFMLVLVLGGNYLVLFVGWEGVGLCSYLLIGFYFLKHSATTAGNKAFIVNRIGDFGFSLGMFLIFATFGTLDFERVFVRAGPMAAENAPGVLTAICLLLLVGAAGKSAQVPLYVWLPDAMEGPTPVSALIHAATMVTAGVYMVARSAPLFLHAPLALDVVAVVGLVTAVMAATIGLTDGRHHRSHAIRHQEGVRVLDGLAAWLHVRGFGRGRILSRNLPRRHSCLLQGASLSRRRQCDPRTERRAGLEAYGRASLENADHIRDVGVRRNRHLWCPAFFGIP
jgi:NADH-quinone oxidoreductase subunit L